MNKCPSCENENLKEEYKYCPICGAILEGEVKEKSAEILKAMVINYREYVCEDAEEEAFIPSVIGALVVAINQLERTAQEVSDKFVEETLNDLEEIYKPVSEYLIKNYDPHCSIIISDNQIKLIRTEIGMPVKSND